MFQLSSVIFVFLIINTTSSQTIRLKNEVIKTIPLKVNQGVAVDENFYYGISNTIIVKCDKKNDKVIKSWSANNKQKKFAHFKHINSGVVITGKLYCAHSRFPTVPNDNTIEIFDVTGNNLMHIETVKMPKTYGSITWIDKNAENDWWVCYAVYGKERNNETKLVKYQYKNGQFKELYKWSFPEQVIKQWGKMSCSGGSWGPDKLLYTTGHDHNRAYVLKIEDNRLKFVRVEENLGLYGQAIAWDRFSKKRVLWGIVKRKNITQNHIPKK